MKKFVAMCIAALIVCTLPILAGSASETHYGIVDQPLENWREFWRMYPYYAPYYGHMYASTSHTAGWRIGTLLLTANAIPIRLESDSPLYSEASYNSQLITYLADGTDILVNGEYDGLRYDGANEVWLLTYSSTFGHYGWVPRSTAFRSFPLAEALIAESTPQQPQPPVSNPAPPAVNNAYGEVYDMGIPDLHGITYAKNSHNLYVLWAQWQMKATGRYYQGEEWDETGVLGDHTTEEIRRMMRNNGYSQHNGSLDQAVVNVLCSLLGNRIVPIYIGGFYNKMLTLTSGEVFGTMNRVQCPPDGSYTRGGEWVQRCLSKLGYYNSTIDGEFGELSIAAVKAFQRDHGFQQTSYVTMGVARKMLEKCYFLGFSLDDLP